MQRLSERSGCRAIPLNLKTELPKAQAEYQKAKAAGK
jgi:hypothetical protein